MTTYLLVLIILGSQGNYIHVDAKFTNLSNCEGVLAKALIQNQGVKVIVKKGCVLY